MPNHKLVFEFEGTAGNANTAGSKSGWTESWYINVAQTLDVAVAQSIRRSVIRRALLTPGWSLTAIRVSPLNAALRATRLGALVFVPPADAPGTYTNGVGVPDEQPYDAVEIAVQGLNGHRRNFQMRGIGQDIISPGARFLNPPRWTTAFPGWLGMLRGDAVGGVQLPPLSIRFTDPNGSGNIVAVWNGQAGSPVGATTQTPFIDVQTPAVVAAGNGMTISGSAGAVGLNGTWIVADVPGGAGVGLVRIKLQAKRRRLVTGAMTVPGTARFYVYGLDSVAIATPGYGVSRRTGRPPQLTRGRRSNRA